MGRGEERVRGGEKAGGRCVKGPSDRGIGWGSTSLLGGCTICGPDRRKAVRVHKTSSNENSDVALYKLGMHGWGLYYRVWLLVSSWTRCWVLRVCD